MAPLTAAVLGALEAEHAGLASGVNNAVARAAGLLSVAALPLIVGLSGADYEVPSEFSDGLPVGDADLRRPAGARRRARRGSPCATPSRSRERGAARRSERRRARAPADGARYCGADAPPLASEPRRAPNHASSRTPGCSAGVPPGSTGGGARRPRTQDDGA